MSHLLERLPRGGRLAVIRLRSLGDSILTTPALQILKEARPDLRIAVVVEPRFAAVFEGNPDIDRILAPTVTALTRWRPDLVVNFHGGMRSVALTLASRAQYRAGFQHYRAAWAYNVILPRAQEALGVDRKVHTAEHLASAMFFLGVPGRDIPRARLFASPGPRRRGYALIHPFASAPGKTWPADRFVAVARQIRKAGEIDPVVLCGPGDDPAPFAEFEIVRNAPLGEVKSVVRSASLFIGNDSGPAHMAAAFCIPVVVLFGASDPIVWAPWKPVAAEVLAHSSIHQIEIARVLSAIEEVKATA